MLPTELLETCLDSIADDKHSLAMCALAHNSLRYISQRRLFASISLYFPSDGVQLDSVPVRLLAALEMSPPLGAYVQRFSISCANHLSVAITDLLPHLLERMPALRSLSGRNAFRAVNGPLHHALEKVLKLPTLEHICLRMTVDFPFHLIRTPSLRHLSLIDMGETGTSLAYTCERSPLSLRTLKVNATLNLVCSRATRWLCSAQVELSALEALYLDIQWTGVSNAQKFLERASQSLRLLAIVPYGKDPIGGVQDTLRMMVDLPFRLPSLHTLVIYVAKHIDLQHIVSECYPELLKALDAALGESDSMYPAVREVVLLPCPRGSGGHGADMWWEFRDASLLAVDLSGFGLGTNHIRSQATLDAWASAFPKCAKNGMLRDMPPKFRLQQ
ncbi:hypothetical protein HDZ31DRAFT_84643 [Schizophyllum fasciatum]